MHYPVLQLQNFYNLGTVARLYNKIMFILWFFFSLPSLFISSLFHLFFSLLLLFKSFCSFLFKPEALPSSLSQIGMETTPSDRLGFSFGWISILEMGFSFCWVPKWGGFLWCWSGLLSWWCNGWWVSRGGGCVAVKVGWATWLLRQRDRHVVSLYNRIWSWV